MTRPGTSAMVGVLALATLGLAGCAQPPPAAPEPEPVLGIEELARLDLLPRMKKAAAVGMVSSYDRTGGNDDGFSGAHSFIRKEPEGLVLADLEGPGVIYRIFTPTPTDDIIEFYFDGESSPRIRRTVNELFDGTHVPFLSPVVGGGAGGRFSYVPLTYQRSCKVLVRADRFQFYQINYARYPAGFTIPTYEDPPSEAFLRHIKGAGDLLGESGTDISRHLVPEGTNTTSHMVKKTLNPGQTVTVFDTARPGRIVGLKLGPAAAFAGPDRDILVRMYWDGESEPAVDSPAGDLFGYSFGEPAVRSLLLGTSDGSNYLYLPMPFERSARIDLVSERASGPPVDVQAEVITAPLGKTRNEGRFYARWRRENPTRTGSPYTFLRTSGRGHVVGVILQAQGLDAGGTRFFEGDDRVVIDGDLAIHGTGSEDSFNGGWYDVPGRWESRASFPLSGCLDYQKPLGRTGGYRWMVTDAYPYTKSLDYTIEHAPVGNEEPTDYTSVTLFYSLDPPPDEAPPPPAIDRRVTAPKRIVFVPGWNVPIYTTSLQNATWTKSSTEIGSEQVRYLSMKTTGEDIFGPHHISFICSLPSAGRYEVGIKALRGPGQGIVQMSRHDIRVGNTVNLYAKDRALGEILPLGTQEMSAGDNLLFLNLVGQDPRSNALALDLVEIIFEKVGDRATEEIAGSTAGNPAEQR